MSQTIELTKRDKLLVTDYSDSEGCILSLALQRKNPSKDVSVGPRSASVGEKRFEFSNEVSGKLFDACECILEDFTPFSVEITESP